MNMKKFYIRHNKAINCIFLEIFTGIITVLIYCLLTRTYFEPRGVLILQVVNIISWLASLVFVFLLNVNIWNRVCGQGIIKFFLSRVFSLLCDIILIFILNGLFKYNADTSKVISQIVAVTTNCVLDRLLINYTKRISLTNLFNKIFGISFLAILVIGFLTLFRRPKNFSYLENRLLNRFQFPTLKSFWDKSFQDKTENALTDQIFFGQSIKKRASFLQFVDYSSMGSQICQGRNVYIAKNYVMYDCNSQIINAPLTHYNETNLAKSINIFNGINHYTDAYYYVLDRAYAWNFEDNELLLDGYAYLKQNLTGDYKISRLEVNNYEDYLKYFYLTDHHWNRLGSYQGYKDIVELLGVEDEILSPTKEVTIDSNFYGSMSKNSKAIEISEPFTYYDFDIPKHLEYINGLKGQYGNYADRSNIKYLNYYAQIYGSDYAEIIFDFNDAEKDDLLIIGTSYTNPINRLIASHYNRTYILDPRYYKNYDGSYANLKDYIKEHHIDKVLIFVSTDILDGSIVSLGWEE